MTVSVGGVTFDGATGTPTPPLTAAQLASWAAAAEAFRYRGSPPTGEGSLDAWADLDEADAQAKLRAAGGLVGYVVTVILPHGSVVGVAVAQVRGEWQARAGTVNGGVLVVRFDFDRTADRNSGDNARTIVDVQTAAALAGPWTTETGWTAFAGSDGLGTYAGECSAKVPSVAPDKSKLGLWVRCVLKGVDPDTDPTAIRWVGVVVGVNTSARRDPKQGIGWGSETVYRFAGIAHVLAQLHPRVWYESQEAGIESPVKFQGSTAAAMTKADVGEAIVYNAEGVGNMGTENFQLDAAPAPTVRLHARGRGVNASTWSALAAARNAIAQVRVSWPVLPRIVLDDPDNLLTYEAPWDVSRKPLLGMLATILAPEHKRTFRLAVDWAFAGGPAIRVVPVNLAAAGTAFDLTGPEIIDWRCDFDAAAQADEWFLDAGPRAFLQTVEFQWGNTPVNGVRAWSAAEETAWLAATDAGVKDSLALAHVARRFIVEPVWNLTGYLGGNAIPYLRQTDGSGQETGELAAGTEFPAAHTAWTIDRTIPLGEGVDWTADAYPPSKIAPKAPAIGPLVFFRKAGSPLEVAHTNLQVSVLDDVAGIELGRDSTDGDTIKAKTKDDGFVIVATLSFIHPFSWRVSAHATPPRTDAPRTGFTFLPSHAFRRVDAGGNVIVGTTAAGDAVHAAAGRLDAGGSLVTIRDGYKDWHMTPDGSAEWRRRDASVLTPEPGTVVASIKATLDPGPPMVNATIAVLAPIARRVQSWDLYNPGVTWSASRIVPNLSGGAGAAVVAAANGAAALARPSDWNTGKRNV